MPPKRGKNTNGASPLNPFDVAVEKAEVLQQRAERRRGADALSAYEAAAGAFQEALQLAHSPGVSPSPSSISDCQFALAETLQQWAETLLQCTASLSDDQLTREVEHNAAAKANTLFDEAVQNYNTVRDSTQGDPPESLRVDAAVCCGNVLAAWAELATSSDTETASDMLRRAELYYQAAITKEEDAMTWSNLADVLIQHGELLCKAGRHQEGLSLFAQAHEAYTRACCLSSSEQGDDLPGLLLNWGSGCLAAAGHATESTAAMALLDEAALRLRESISFDRGDPAPHNALGDVLVAKAEWEQRRGDGTRAHQSLETAMTDGYLSALRIQSTHPDALVGVAEVYAQRAKLATAMGDTNGSLESYAAAVEAYKTALVKPELLGDLAQRSDVRYNLACCLVGCGRLEEASVLVKQLVLVGGVALEDALSDSDLASIHSIISS